MDNVTNQTTTAEPPTGKSDKRIPDLTGTRLGDFELLRRLGQGGMGQVYLAEQISLKRKVAIKILRSDLAANDTALQRFKREAEAVARATHANIVQVYAIDEKNGQHFMALEYVEGKNLRDYLEKKGPPDVLICIGILRQVAAALQRASELGIIHRDIKPENILLTRKGEVKVADFGLSRIYAEEQQPLNLTQSGVTMGTPLYMSPEQVEGRALDPRTDIYSLGVTAYHLLVGQPPFRGQTPFEVALQHVQKEAEPLEDIRPDLPPELCLMVRKMMAKKLTERYQTAQEIVRELSQLRDQLVGLSNTQLSAALVAGQPASPLLSLSRSGDSHLTLQLPPVQVRRRFPWLAALGVLLMLGAGTALGLWWNKQHQLKETVEVTPTRPAPEAVDPEKKEELELLNQFSKVKENNNPTDVHKGIYACVDLGWLYLSRDLRKDPKDLKETEQFFQQLRQGKKHQTVRQAGDTYHYLGELGEAVVLAFKDRPKESLDLFDRLLPKANPNTVKFPLIGKKPNPDKKPLPAEAVQAKFFWEYLGTNQYFRKMLSQALERNYANMQKPLPTHLEFFRAVPHPIPPEPKKATAQ